METDKVTMLRYRGSKLSKVKKIDIFPKIEETYKETSSLGGTFSVFSFLLIMWLVYSEINYYLDSKFIFKFSPDTDYDAKLKINVDITVAMPCSNLGADILDSTNQNAYKFGSLEEEDTWFELAPNQQIHFDNKRHFNSYLREEYHAIKVTKLNIVGVQLSGTMWGRPILDDPDFRLSKDLLWKSSFSTIFGDMPERISNPDRPYDACRIFGSLVLNKVSGNFHITAGKSLNLPRGHIHISAFMSERDYNFSHRINRFSFGDPSPGIVHPLEGDELITNNGMTLFNYFIEVVPTNVKTFLTSVNTYQYSVKELSRPIDHDKGSHGMPGIFFKYDMSALKVTVSQERDHLGMFLARLCSIIGGIYVCSGFLNSFVQFCYNFICCNTKANEKTKTHPSNYKPIPDVVPVNL